MSILQKLVVLFTTVFFISLPVIACDFDGDTIDDPTAVEEQGDGSWTWRTLRSSDGNTDELAGFGQSGYFTAPAHWFGQSNPAEYGYIDNIFFWTVPNGDRLNFGRTAISYYPGHDFNGDGIPDLLKFENRCNKLKRACYRRKARGNFAFNNSDGVNTFKIPVQQGTGLFGGGLDPIVVADTDGDGDADICFAKPRKSNPKVFTLKCTNLDREKVDTRKLGRLFNPPLALKRIGAPDYIVLYQARKGQGDTKLVVYPPAGDPIERTVPAIGKVMVGDWMGTGSQQVGVATTGLITYVDPVAGSTGSVAVPAGEPVDCYNNFQGPGEDRVLTSRTACKIFNCKKKKK